MARADLDPEERDRTPLQLHQIVTCVWCGTDWDHIFTAPDGIFEVEDLVDPISERVFCTGCKSHSVVTYEGWVHHEDAG